MKNFLALILIIFVVCISSKIKAEEGVQTVDYIDISRYLGTWYEIARFQNDFQKNCEATKVNYQLRENGDVDVHNQCRDILNPKKINDAQAIAKVVDKKTNAKLAVSFVPFFNNFGWFAGDYWILAIDSEYRYALVGNASKNYLWILSRKQELDQSIIEELKEVARKNGFETRRLFMTPKWE